MGRTCTRGSPWGNGNQGECHKAQFHPEGAEDNVVVGPGNPDEAVQGDGQAQEEEGHGAAQAQAVGEGAIWIENNLTGFQNFQ